MFKSHSENANFHLENATSARVITLKGFCNLRANDCSLCILTALKNRWNMFNK